MSIPGRDKKYFSHRLNNIIKIDGYSGYKEKNMEENDDMGILCWCFGK